MNSLKIEDLLKKAREKRTAKWLTHTQFNAKQPYGKLSTLAALSPEHKLLLHLSAGFSKVSTKNPQCYLAISLPAA
jgi:hypothetical protein